MAKSQTPAEGTPACFPEEMQEVFMRPLHIAAHQMGAVQNYWAGFSRYANEFVIPYLLSTHYFARAERDRLMTAPPWESFLSYLELAEFSGDIAAKNLMASIRALNDVGGNELKNALAAVFNTVTSGDGDGENLEEFFARQARTMDRVANIYPQAIRDIEPEYGFHFERGDHELFAESDRFYVYKIGPTDPNVRIDDSAKPILILPPYVLGANILSFLPGDDRSYTHCYANQGIPTYIRILKKVDETPALQTMRGEDDALDTKAFCEKIMARHGKPVTLNGYCQGGFSAVCNILSGELDGVVDALLTCVSPMDGTRSRGLSGFLNSLPQRFNDLDYGTKTLENGNQVADGKLMGWVYKLKSIENEAPLVAFYRDMMMVGPRKGKIPKISKTALALNYWLTYERTDLPLCITEMSFASYNVPITKDGDLPVKLFGRTLNFKRLAEKGIPWLICYGERDDLVEKETALAPKDFIDVEVSPFPKGHVAIATSWSDPKSEFALHTRFGEDGQYRGPVRYHLDLDNALRQAAESAQKPKPASEAPPSAGKTASKSAQGAGKPKSSAKSAKKAASKKSPAAD